MVKDKGDLELEIIVLNEYVSVRRGSMGGWREVGVQGEGGWPPEAGLITHLAAIRSPPSGLALD